MHEWVSGRRTNAPMAWFSQIHTIQAIWPLCKHSPQYQFGLNTGNHRSSGVKEGSHADHQDREVFEIISDTEWVNAEKSSYRFPLAQRLTQPTRRKGPIDPNQTASSKRMGQQHDSSHTLLSLNPNHSFRTVNCGPKRFLPTVGRSDGKDEKKIDTVRIFLTKSWNISWSIMKEPFG